MTNAALGAAIRVLSADKAVVIGHNVAMTEWTVSVGINRYGPAPTLDAAVELAMQGEGSL